MDLLQFARGPALQWSLFILVLGTLWRLTGIYLLKRKTDFSEPRNPSSLAGLRLIVTRMKPHAPFMKAHLFNYVLGYVSHVGLAVVVFLYLPHILFVKDLTGLTWPYLPNGVVYFAGALTLAAFVALLVMRLASPVKRLLSNFDDWFSWFVTVAPVATGLMAAAHVGARYETLLALHILSVELLFVWFPFGKLMHAVLVFASRGTTGMAFERKGATL